VESNKGSGEKVTRWYEWTDSYECRRATGKRWGTGGHLKDGCACLKGVETGAKEAHRRECKVQNNVW